MICSKEGIDSAILERMIKHENSTPDPTINDDVSILKVNYRRQLEPILEMLTYNQTKMPEPEWRYSVRLMKESILNRPVEHLIEIAEPKIFEKAIHEIFAEFLTNVERNLYEINERIFSAGLKKTKNDERNAIQRYYIVFRSIFGIWSDLDDSILLRIIPEKNSVRLKVADVRSADLINKIASFCGRTQTLRRKGWLGFDLISDLVKHLPNLYVEGNVHMPNAKRKNKVTLAIVDESLIRLDFYFNDSGEARSTGEIFLKKNYEKKLFNI